MAVNLITWRNSVINLLGKNNTTTSSYDISNPLAVRVKKIVGGMPDYGNFNTQFPIIFVRIEEYREERNTLGATSHRSAEVTFGIYPFTQYGPGQAAGGRLSADDEAVKLTQKIQDLIRAKNDLSITSMEVLGIETTFDQRVEDSATYVRGSKISVNCQTLVT